MNISLDVGFCFYETDVETVRRAIESVKDHVRNIFAVDGKYEFFDSSDELSSNEVRDYLAEIDNVILVDYPNRKENEKRQVYLDMAQDHQSDWLLILDADEYITDETDWDMVYEDLQNQRAHSLLPKIFGVTLRITKERESVFPRLWRCPYLIQYTKTHNFFQFKTDGKIYRSSVTFQPIRGIFMKGNDKARSPDYVKKSYEYQKKLIAYEKPFKEKYRKIAENTKSYNHIDPRLPPGVPIM